jgi:hypothetical protein
LYYNQTQVVYCSTVNHFQPLARETSKRSQFCPPLDRLLQLRTCLSEQQIHDLNNSQRRNNDDGWHSDSAEDLVTII